MNKDSLDPRKDVAHPPFLFEQLASVLGVEEASKVVLVAATKDNNLVC